MASGVFGTPITVDTVRASGLYQEPITQRDCADYAEKMMNAGGKDNEVLKFVDNLKSDYGDGISAKCVIYNATGTTLNYVSYRDFHGHIYDTPYPATISNGQWGGFLHIHPTWGFGTGCAGAVVYRSVDPISNVEVCDWVYSWSDPYVGGSNRVYNLIRVPGYFGDSYNWDEFYSILENADRSTEDTNYGYSSEIMIGEGTTTNVRGVFKRTST